MPLPETGWHVYLFGVVEAEFAQADACFRARLSPNANRSSLKSTSAGLPCLRLA